MFKLFASLIFLFSFSALSAQPIDKEKLVLEVSTVTSKNYEEVRSALHGLNGVTLLAFCEESKSFLLSYDPTIISSTDEIQKVVTQLDPSYKTKVRKNITVDELISSCSKYLADGVSIEETH
jgi:hypothetical protein